MSKTRLFYPTDILVEEFLKIAQARSSSVNLIQVLKARVYKIGESNVLIRAASKSTRNRYFFGLNYITVEEMANLDNPFIAFICGSLDRILILPATILFNNLKNISHDRNGEYKINLDDKLNIILKGSNNRLECNEYINGWDLLFEPPSLSLTKNTVEESLHSVIQGRLIEIGNIRGFQTYCPNKSKQFNGKLLSEISTLTTCPELQFSDYSLLRQIDVLWFRNKNLNLIPECAFEVELSTGTWSGVGRMSTLLDYGDTKLFVVSDDERKYKKILNTLPLKIDRYKHIKTQLIGDLYSAELQLRELRFDVGL